MPVLTSRGPRSSSWFTLLGWRVWMVLRRLRPVATASVSRRIAALVPNVRPHRTIASNGPTSPSRRPACFHVRHRSFCGEVAVESSASARGALPSPPAGPHRRRRVIARRRPGWSSATTACCASALPCTFPGACATDGGQNGRCSSTLAWWHYLCGLPPAAHDTRPRTTRRLLVDRCTLASLCLLGREVRRITGQSITGGIITNDLHGSSDSWRLFLLRRLRIVTPGRTPSDYIRNWRVAVVAAVLPSMVSVVVRVARSLAYRLESCSSASTSSLIGFVPGASSPVVDRCRDGRRDPRLGVLDLFVAYQSGVSTVSPMDANRGFARSVPVRPASRRAHRHHRLHRRRTRSRCSTASSPAWTRRSGTSKSARMKSSDRHLWRLR